LFEIDSNDSVVWEYIVPVNSLGPIPQGGSSIANNTFQAYRYGPNYPAFVGKNLTPQGPIELNPLPNDCQIYSTDTAVGSIQPTAFRAKMYPNPTMGKLHVSLPTGESGVLIMTNLLGAEVVRENISGGEQLMDVSSLPAGIYIYRLSTQTGQVATGKIIKE
jgi:hypothetical protein